MLPYPTQSQPQQYHPAPVQRARPSFTLDNSIRQDTLASLNTLIPTDHLSSLTCICKLPGDYVATASKDSTIKIWNSKNKSLITTFSGHKTVVTTLKAVQCGTESLLLSGS